MLASWGLLAALCGFTAVDSDPYELAPIFAAMNFDGVTTTTRWMDCGMVNGFYVDAGHVLVLCNELRELKPGVIRFIVAHELAHAVISQRGVPVIGSQEVAADELATVVLSVSGHMQDAIDATEYWLEKANPEIPSDPHPGDTRRGLAIGCLAMGSLHKTAPFCTGNSWSYTIKVWNRLLEMH